MTAKGQDRYLFIAELINKKHQSETWANGLIIVLTFFMGIIILFVLLIGLVVPINLFTEREMFQLCAFFISNLSLFIGAIVKGLEKDKNFNRLKDALKAIAQEDDFENIDLKTNPVLKRLFD